MKVIRTYEILRRGLDIKPDLVFRNELMPVPGDECDPIMTLLDDIDTEEPK